MQLNSGGAQWFGGGELSASFNPCLLHESVSGIRVLGCVRPIGDQVHGGKAVDKRLECRRPFPAPLSYGIPAEVRISR
jgi:hypothetical protein